MRKFILVSIALLLAFNSMGCESLRKKFTRKKKAPVKMPRFYQVKEYKKVPSPELYKKHYSYWQSWQSELIKVLGANHKKDMRCIEEIVSNLKDMQNILLKEKADELEPRIARLSKVKDVIFGEDLSVANREFIKSTLEREDRYIRRDFHYTKVKDKLKKSFDDETS